jgi:hypothetical protein
MLGVKLFAALLFRPLHSTACGEDARPVTTHFVNLQIPFDTALRWICCDALIKMLRCAI